MLALLAAVLAGCTVSKTETSTTNTNCSIGGCETTSKGSPAPGPMIGLLVLGTAFVARNRLTARRS